MPMEPSEELYDRGNGNHSAQARFSRPKYEKEAQRSVLLVNLPEGVTHADIANVVRGGMVLDIYLRTQSRTASISFLEEADAREYLGHVKRHDLYIRGKRVSKLEILL